MKFSLALTRYYNKKYDIARDPFTYGLDEVVNRMGLQLGAIEDVKNLGSKYDGIVVAKVVKCEKHPDADKLSLCRVDDAGVVQNVERGDDGFVQVVCGAPNVAEGQLIAWIPPGVTVPQSHGHEPFVLESRIIRGKVSNGMIASLRELSMGDDHEGILVIEEQEVGAELAKPGTSFKQLYNLDDVIIDCENKMFTHRPDCFGNLGIAREVAGIFGDKYTSPEWYKTPVVNEKTADLVLATSDQTIEKVPRFTIQAVAGVEVKKSPVWLQAYLQKVGIKSINNIVDFTNYFMMLTGQPLHAFDYDKVKKLSSGEVKVYPRMANEGEEIELLNGKKIKLSSEDIVIATDTKAIALGGVMGGSETEVDEHTKNIIIECANFDMYNIRRTSMRHGLFTDAVTRFNKGQSPLQNSIVISKTVADIVENAKGKVASDMLDIANFDLSADNLSHVSTNVGFINARLGTELNADQIKTLLENVEFKVEFQGPTLEITVPYWRMDISIAEDVVEEVGRLYGYQNVPVKLPNRTSKPASRNQLRDFRQSLRNKLVNAGANEVLTYSFVHGDLMRNAGVDPEQWAYHLRNALSPDLQYYRTSLTPSLLNKVHSNIKAQAGKDDNEFALFEFGKIHVRGYNEEEEPDLPKQMHRLALVFAADGKASKNKGSAYYQAKKYLELVTGGQATYVMLENNEYPITGPYQIKRSAIVFIAGEMLGVVGEFNAKARKALKLPKYCAGFEINMELLQKHIAEKKYQSLSEYPSTIQDITFEVSQEKQWAELHNLIRAELEVAKAENSYNYSLMPTDIYQADDSDKKRHSFRIELSSYKKTLVTEEVNKLLDHISGVVGDKLQAIRV